MTYTLGALELSYANGYVVYKDVESARAGDWRASAAWSGLKIYIDSIAPKAREFTLEVNCNTRSAFEALMFYDISNFNWSTEDDTYLIEDSTRRWRVRGCFIGFKRPGITNIDCTVKLLLDKPNSFGETINQKSGTISSSPTSITGLTNGGNVNAPFTSMAMTGKYSAANLAAAALAHNITGYNLAIADVLHDEAVLTFYLDDMYAALAAVDPVESITRTDRNKLSSSGVTYASENLVFANSSSLVMRYQIGHPLLSDPILTLSVNTVVGSPTLEVSNDGNYYWEVDKALVAGDLEEYTLTKLAGLGDFRWRLLCGAGDSFKLSRYLLESYHSISGQQPLPYIQADATDEELEATLSAGNMDYDIRWRDKYSV